MTTQTLAAADSKPDALDRVTTDIRGAMQLYGYSESTIRRMLANNEIPGTFRRGRILRFHVPTILKHIESLADAGQQKTPT